MCWSVVERLAGRADPVRGPQATAEHGPGAIWPRERGRVPKCFESLLRWPCSQGGQGTWTMSNHTLPPPTHATNSCLVDSTTHAKLESGSSDTTTQHHIVRREGAQTGYAGTQRGAGRARRRAAAACMYRAAAVGRSLGPQSREYARGRASNDEPHTQTASQMHASVRLTLTRSSWYNPAPASAVQLAAPDLVQAVTGPLGDPVTVCTPAADAPCSACKPPTGHRPHRDK